MFGRSCSPQSAEWELQDSFENTSNDTTLFRRITRYILEEGQSSQLHDLEHTA